MNNYNKTRKISSKTFENKNNSQKVRDWEKENKEAINLYNQRIKKYGLFSDGFRQF